MDFLYVNTIKCQDVRKQDVNESPAERQGHEMMKSLKEETR
jgi:hypothetical protein